MHLHALISLFEAAVFGALLLGFVYLALRSATGTVAVIFGIWVITVALRDTVDLSVTLSGFRISAMDVLSAIMVAVGVSRALTLGVGNSGRGLALGLIFLLVIHIARGIAAFGVQVAVNAGRPWLYFAAALVYAATVPGGWSSRVWRLFPAVGSILAIVAVPYLLIEGLHTSTQEIFRNGEWVTSRPVVATGALLILQSAVIALAIGWPSPTKAGWVAAGMCAMVVLLQHRTVWVAGIVVALTGFCSWSATRVRTRPSTVSAVTGIVLLLLPAAAWGFASTGVLVASAKETASSRSTLAWRTASWTELVSTHHSTSDLIGGGPSGESWSRVIDKRVATASPHNGFVDAYLRFGLAGVLLIVGLGFLLWRRRGQIAVEAGLPGRAIGLILLTQLAFNSAYLLDSVQGLIDGILVAGLMAPSLVRSHQTERSTPALLLDRPVTRP